MAIVLWIIVYHSELLRRVIARGCTVIPRNKGKRKTLPNNPKDQLDHPGPPTPPFLPGRARPPRLAHIPLSDRGLNLRSLVLGRLHSPLRPPLPAWGGR